MNGERVFLCRPLVGFSLWALLLINLQAAPPPPSFSAPEPNSEFPAPASVTISGQVDLPPSEWFEIRAFKIPTSTNYKARTDPVRIATIRTNPFSLYLTNLPAGLYTYSFELSTLDSSVSNRISFSVTNVPFRLGPFSITDLGSLGGTQTVAQAINNRGQAVGLSRTPSGQSRAVLFENGQVLDLGTLGGAFSRALALNNNGVIVGAAENSNGVVVPFRYATGQMASLGFDQPGEATAINDRGDIVGHSGGAGFAVLDGSIRSLSFLPRGINNHRTTVGSWGTPAIEDLDLPAPFVSDPTENGYIDAKLYAGGTALAVNDSRQFTGFGEDGTYRRYSAYALLYNFQDLSLASVGLASYAQGNAINRWGEIVGFHLPGWVPESMGHPSPNPPSASDLKLRHAFLRNDQGAADLNSLIPANSGWLLQEATGINDSGQIVGYGIKDGQIRAFLLTPIFMLDPASLQFRFGNRMDARFLTTPGTQVRIETSPDFQDWTPISTNTAAGFQLPFTENSQQPHRFYRGTILSE